MNKEIEANFLKAHETRSQQSITICLNIDTTYRNAANPDPQELLHTDTLNQNRQQSRNLTTVKDRVTVKSMSYSSLTQQIKS